MFMHRQLEEQKKDFSILINGAYFRIKAIIYKRSQYVLMEKAKVFYYFRYNQITRTDSMPKRP